MITKGKSLSITDRHLLTGGASGEVRTVINKTVQDLINQNYTILKNEIVQLLESQGALLETYNEYPFPSLYGLTRFYGSDEFPLLTTHLATTYLTVSWRLNDPITTNYKVFKKTDLRTTTSTNKVYYQAVKSGIYNTNITLYGTIADAQTAKTTFVNLYYEKCGSDGARKILYLIDRKKLYGLMGVGYNLYDSTYLLKGSFTDNIDEGDIFNYLLQYEIDISGTDWTVGSSAVGHTNIAYIGGEL